MSFRVVLVGEQGAQSIYPVKPDLKGPIPAGKEFDQFATFEVGISDSSKINNNDTTTRKEYLLHLGHITPYYGDIEDLKTMAETGMIPDFNEIYDHWKALFSTQITFFPKTHPILSRRKKR